jgi:hypothetical protein
MRRSPPQRRPKIERFTGRNFRPYVNAIGQLALAWNDLHESLALLFIELLAKGRAYPATDVWNSAVHDRPKRMLIRAVLRTWKSEDAKFVSLVDDVTWLLDQADKVEDARNDAIHSPLVFFDHTNVFAQQRGWAGKVMPSLAFGNKRAGKLRDKDLLTEFRWCRDAAVALREYASQLYEAVAAPIPWPDRPALPNRGHQRKSPLGKAPAP